MGVRVAVLLLVAVPSLALAKKKDPVVRENDAALVEDLANQAAARYAAGDYAEAIALTKKAYDIRPLAPLLFNIATIYDKKLKEPELAADFYRRVLAAADADPAMVQKAAARLEAIKKAAAEPKDSPPKDNAPKDNAPPKDNPPKDNPPSAPPPQQPPVDQGESPLAARRRLFLAAGGVALAVGVAGIAVGATFGALAMGDNNAAAKLCNGPVCSDEKALTLTSQAFTEATVSTIAFVAGGVLAAAGLVLLIAAPSAKKAAVAFSPTVAPGFAGASLGGAF